MVPPPFEFTYHISCFPTPRSVNEVYVEFGSRVLVTAVTLKRDSSPGIAEASAFLFSLLSISVPSAKLLVWLPSTFTAWHDRP